MRTLLLLGVAALVAASSHAEDIRCAGVLANSGESGDALVRFAPKYANGMGVAVDRYGTLWDRGGEGRVNRYATDGRLIAHYAIPQGNDRNGDRIVVVGNDVVVRVRGWLHKIGVDAPSGSSFQPLNLEADISFGVHRGRIACIDKSKRLFLLDPASGERSDLCTLTFELGVWMDMDPDGVVYVMDRHWQLHKIVRGEDVADGWPKQGPGEEPQLIDAAGVRHWYGHGWHGTIRRYDTDMRPDPGVVQGGASGSFIGHLPQNSELNNGRGMAYVAGRLYAVSGFGGIMHLLEWKPKTRKMAIVRRLGSLSRLAGIGLDRDGRVYAVNGMYEWSDGPGSPQHFGMTGDVCGQVVMLPNDNMVAPAIQYGNQSRLMFGRLNIETHLSGQGNIKLSKEVQKDGAGAAVYRHDGKLAILIVSAKGKAQLEQIESNGKYRTHLGSVNLTVSSPVTRWTTLAMKDADTLLAAGDGHVIEFARDGMNWREKRRFNEASGGDDTRFGSRIDIAADAGRLWVSDTERHRVVCMGLSNNRHLATFGATDTASAGLTELSSPAAIAARGSRAVVFDAGNQRLVKLELE